MTVERPDQTVLSLQGVTAIAIASVCDEKILDQCIGQLSDCFQLPVFCAKTAVEQAGVRNVYTNPESLGVDRWLAMLAAFNAREEYESGVMVVSCGTAMTLDYVDAEGCHEGGYILPGLALMCDSLLSATGKIRFERRLFEVNRGPGADTASAVQHGALHAALSVLEASWEDISERWGGEPELWITGGDGELVHKMLSLPCQYVEDLVLDGLLYVA